MIEVSSYLLRLRCEFHKVIDDPGDVLFCPVFERKSRVLRVDRRDKLSDMTTISSRCPLSREREVVAVVESAKLTRRCF